MANSSAAAWTPEALRIGVVQACESVPEVLTAYVFGSQARGTARPDSDLDVAIDLGHVPTPLQRGQIKLRLIAALTDRLGTLGERADIVDLRETSSAVAFRALRDGKLVKESSRAVRVQLEARIMRAYDDDAPRRALIVRSAIRAAEQMGKDVQRGGR